MRKVAPSRSVSSHPLKMTIKGVGKNKELGETIFHFFAVLLVSLKSQQQRAELPQESVNGPVNSIQEEGLKSEILYPYGNNTCQAGRRTAHR